MRLRHDCRALGGWPLFDLSAHPLRLGARAAARTNRRLAAEIIIFGAAAQALTLGSELAQRRRLFDQYPSPPAENIKDWFSFRAQHFNRIVGTSAESEVFARAIHALKVGLRGLYPIGPELRMIRIVDGKNRTGRLWKGPKFWGSA